MFRMILTATILAATPAAAQAPAWSAQVQRTVNAKLVTPRSAQVRGDTCVARVRIATDGFGMIMDYKVVTPCASPILNRAIDDTIMKIGQFASPPGNKPQVTMLNFTWRKPAA